MLCSSPPPLFLSQSINLFNLKSKMAESRIIIKTKTNSSRTITSTSMRGRKRKLRQISYDDLESSADEETAAIASNSENTSFIDICRKAADQRLQALESDDDGFHFELGDEDHERVEDLIVNVPLVATIREAQDDDYSLMVKQGRCFLCKESLVGEVTVMSMRLHVPLPSSFLSPISLLKYFGVSMIINDANLGNLVSVDICWQCHSMVLESDKVYQSFVAIGKRMTNVWPHLMKNCTLLDKMEEAFNFESVENYEEEKDEIEIGRCESPKAKVRKARKNKKPGTRLSDLRARMCELCGNSCAGLSNWENHCESDHKVAKHWIRYTYQFSLKQAILKKVKDIAVKNKYEEKVKCPACNKIDVIGKNLPDHIITYHNIAIDESSLTVSPAHQFTMDHNVETTEISQGESFNLSNPSTDIVRRFDSEGREIVPDNVIETGIVEYIDGRVTQVGMICNICNIFIEGSLLEHIELSHMDIIVLLKRDQTAVVRYKVNTVTSLESCDNIRSYKPKRLWKKLKFSCNICGSNKFSDLVKMLEHKRSEHHECEESHLDYDSVLVECQFCGYRVIGTPALRLHTIEKHVTPENQPFYEYNCKACIFQSANKEEYKRHMELKHGKNFNQHVQCEVCGKMVSSKYIGVHHEKMHSQSRNYECGMCDMKFFDCQSLKCHFTEEHVENEYECQPCQLKFKKYHQLRQHRIYVHSTKVYKCPCCDASFKRKCDQSSHTKRKHMEREYYYCNFCSKQFNDRGKRNKHLIMVHGVNREDTWSENFARNKRQKDHFHRQEGPKQQSQQHDKQDQLEIHQQQPHQQAQDPLEIHQHQPQILVIDSSEKQTEHQYHQQPQPHHHHQIHVVPHKQEIGSSDGTLMIEQVPQFGGFMHPHFTMHH